MTAFKHRITVLPSELHEGVCTHRRRCRKAKKARGNAVSNQQPYDPEDPIPFMQKLLDNPFLLLFLGVLIPMVVYTLWGVIDILMIPLAP